MAAAVGGTLLAPALSLLVGFVVAGIAATAGVAAAAAGVAFVPLATAGVAGADFAVAAEVVAACFPWPLAALGAGAAITLPSCVFFLGGGEGREGGWVGGWV